MPVNSLYLQEGTIRKIHDELERQGIVQLYEFLTPDIYHMTQKRLEQYSYKLVKEPLWRKYRQRSLPKQFFPKEVYATLQQLVGTKKVISFTALQLGWRDYQILYDKMKEKPGIDIIFDFTPHWPRSAGGEVTYKWETGETTALPIQSNTVSIVKRTKQAQKYIQYVNNHARERKRIFLLATIS